ncbi:MAG: IS30 family transposase, partial [Schwartzia sp.]|nr:IS30 family transposase [Schwartzia sp. (in: firmicutes)]
MTPYQRGQIQALMEQKLPKTQIAKQVGIARSTLYEELKRGTVDQMRNDLTHYKRYFADTGQLIYEENRKASRKPCKLASAAPFLQHLEHEVLQNKISPDAVCGRAKLEKAFPVMLCTKTIYNYIDLGLIPIKSIDLP